MPVSMIACTYEHISRLRVCMFGIEGCCGRHVCIALVHTLSVRCVTSQSCVVRQMHFQIVSEHIRDACKRRMNLSVKEMFDESVKAIGAGVVCTYS
jgi:hypothetical protein